MENKIDIQLFIEQYKLHAYKIEEDKIDFDKTRFNDLFSKWGVLHSEMMNYEKKNATNYNIFNILKNIAHLEVITHTPFLADILNIKGKHAQGELFYKEFLKQLSLNNINDFLPDNDWCYFIEEPKYIGVKDVNKNTGGSIDILISYRNSKKTFAIAVENKIGASDQEKQLHRYYNYLQQTYKDNFLLIYLTKNGAKPEMPYSIDEKLFNELYDKGTLKLMSYKKHITSILENTIDSIEAYNIKVLIIQYLQIIKHL